MNLKKFLAATLISITSFSVYAEDAEAPSVDLAIDFATDYIWRGTDMYAGGMYDNNSEDHAVFNTAMSIMPSITVYTPIEGLTYNIWVAYALTYRDSTEGLGAADEIDFTFDYSFANKAGDWSATYIMYAYPTTKTGAGVTKTYNEFGLSYTAKILLSPSLGVAVADDQGGDTLYYNLGISHAFELGKIGIEPSLTYGYWYNMGDTTTNWSHLDIALPISFAVNEKSSITLTPIGVYRMYNDTATTGTITSTKSTNGTDKPALIAAVTLGFSTSF